MKPQEINKSISSMKIHLIRSESIEYWLNFISLLLFIGMFVYFKIEEDLKNKSISLFTIILLILIILLIRHKLIGLNLKGYKLKLSSEDFKIANKAAADLNDWNVISNTDHYFLARGYSGWQWDGIQITAIHQNGNLYLNSIETPSIRSNPFALRKKKRMKLKLIGQYQAVLKGVNVSEVVNKELNRKEKEFWNESEWTLANTLIRIILYSISIPFVFISIWGIIAGAPNGVLVGVPVIVICCTYIYSDVKITLEKLKRKNKRY